MAVQAIPSILLPWNSNVALLELGASYLLLVGGQHAPAPLCQKVAPVDLTAVRAAFRSQPSGALMEGCGDEDGQEGLRIIL
jgi:hypothetical protein